MCSPISQAIPPITLILPIIPTPHPNLTHPADLPVNPSTPVQHLPQALTHSHNGLLSLEDENHCLFGWMISRLRERFRQWLLARDMLLVNFGSGPGRVPLVMLSRRKVTGVTRQDTRISFSSSLSEHKGWTFTVHTKTTAAAEWISDELKRRARHILEPLGDITCITHARLDDNEATRPRLIGGDISIAGIPASDYWQHGNGAWMLRTVFAEPAAAPVIRPPSQLPSSPNAQPSDPQRGSSSGSGSA